MSAAQCAPRASLPSEGFVCRNQLLEVIPFSASTLARRVADGSFPKPIRVSKRLNAWNVRDVRAFIESLEANA